MFTSQSQTAICLASVTLTGQFQCFTIDPKIKITETILQHHFFISTHHIDIHVMNQKPDFIISAMRRHVVTHKHKFYRSQITTENTLNFS